MTRFMPGLELNELFYHEAIRPILKRNFPDLRHAAACLGDGSDVLGYDDEMSTDHDWGLRQQLFLPPEDVERQSDAIHEVLAQQLPTQFRGYTVNFGPADEEGVRLRQRVDGGPVAHRIEVTTVGDFVQNYLGYDLRQPPTVTNWLTFPQQLLSGVTGGRVFADSLGELTAVRATLAYYPRDVWLYLLVGQWSRIGQEEHLLGRSGYRGDELGAAVMAARLVHDLMQLCFLMERTYAPYPKWFGTAFAQLDCASQIGPLLSEVLASDGWQESERTLAAAYEWAARMHNALGVTAALEPAVSNFHDRPFQVIDADRFVSALRKAITDPEVRAIQTNVGSIDQFSHSTDLRSYPDLHRRLESLYR